MGGSDSTGVAHPGAHEDAPFARMLGVRVRRITPAEVEAEVVAHGDLLNRNGVMHGGALMAVADGLGGTLAFANLAPGKGTTTIESKTNFFRAVPKDDLVRAVCIPLHVGRRTIVCRTDLFRSDGKLAAQVTQTQLVLDTDSRTTA